MRFLCSFKNMKKMNKNKTKSYVSHHILENYRATKDLAKIKHKVIAIFLLLKYGTYLLDIQQFKQDKSIRAIITIIQIAKRLDKIKNIYHKINRNEVSIIPKNLLSHQQKIIDKLKIKSCS